MSWLYDRMYPAYRSSGIPDRLRRRRFNLICEALGLVYCSSVLDVGCAAGNDFAAFAWGKYGVMGVDVVEVPKAAEFVFMKRDARDLKFEDNSFDAVVSIGVLEHIQPIEDLCKATKEIARVGKSFCVIVPSSGTWIEPHTWSPFWHARAAGRKPASHFDLNYFSDEAWLQFPGFEGAQTRRFWYAPGVQNLMIWKPSPTLLVSPEWSREPIDYETSKAREIARLAECRAKKAQEQPLG